MLVSSGRNIPFLFSANSSMFFRPRFLWETEPYAPAPESPLCAHKTLPVEMLVSLPRAGTVGHIYASGPGASLGTERRGGWAAGGQFTCYSHYDVVVTLS